jgi:hypothetical protein
LIIRHGEKTGDKDDIGLSKAGAKRARDYAAFFVNSRIHGESIKPDFLFAAAPSKHSDRPRLTLEPLSQKLHKPIDDDYDEKDVAGLARQLRSPRYAGGRVLICWHHGEIPNLLKQFGVDPQKLLGGKDWPEDVFGWLVILRFGPDGSVVSSSVVNELLEKDDGKHPPPR